MSFGVWHKSVKENKEGVSYDPTKKTVLYAEDWNEEHRAYGILCGYAMKYSQTAYDATGSWQILDDITISLETPKAVFVITAWIRGHSPSGAGNKGHNFDVAVDSVRVCGADYPNHFDTRDEAYFRNAMGSITVIKEVEAGSHTIELYYLGSSGARVVDHGLTVLAFTRP